MRESTVLGDLRVQVQSYGCTTFRNNVGMLKNEYGRVVRFGLCEGSSDTIGWTEYVIEQKDVGRKVAIFTAFETKRPVGGKPPTDEQVAFVGRVQLAGGIAAFCKSAEHALDAIMRWRLRKGGM